MLPETIRPLTQRQRAVMERIDRRIPIKVIALELGVSDTRINQHIRALKDIYGAASLSELVENYRISEGLTGEDAPGENAPDDGAVEDAANQGPLDGAAPDNSAGPAPLREDAYSKKQLTDEPAGGDEWPRDDRGYLVIGDVMPLAEQAPWLRLGEPRVVPGLLDGEHAVLFRMVAVLLIATGILAAVVLMVTAAVALSTAMDGKADLPAEHWQGPA
ncbi:MAG: hypothetical protein ACXIT4_05000 [Erythrobacter sp.]